MESPTLNNDITTPLEDDMDYNTTPMEKLNYEFYFEVNQSNYLYICNMNKHFIQFKGYNWDNVWDTNQNCNICANTSSNNYPITNTQKNNQSIPIGEGGLSIKKNTFLLLDDIKLKDTVTMSCSSYISTNGCIPYSYSNLCMNIQESITTPNEEIGIEETTPDKEIIIEDDIKILDENNQEYSQSVSCSGKECLRFFPPSELEYKNTKFYKPTQNINNIIDCNSKTLEYSMGYPACFDNNGNPVQICYNGNPIITYNLYKPLNYSKLPNINSNNEYIEPTTPINAAFYNVYPFITELEIIQSYTDNGNNLPEGTFAVYKVSYSIYPYQFENQENQLNDFIILQQYLNSTFSSWFKKTILYETLQENINQIISDFCYYTSNTTSTICKKMIENFSYKPFFKNKYILLIIILIIILFLKFFIK